MSPTSGLSKDEAADVSGEYVLTVEKINRTTKPELDQELFDKVFGKDKACCLTLSCPPIKPSANPEASEADDGKLKKADEEGAGQTVLLPITR